jgi:ABC-type uncharacterized transport system permease subunit
LAAAPGAEAVAVGDVASVAQTRDVAEQINRLGPFDAVIHNVAVGYREPRRIQTEEFLMKYTTFGRHIYVVGGNAEAARLFGIDVAWTKTQALAVTRRTCGTERYSLRFTGWLSNRHDGDGNGAVAEVVLLMRVQD